MSKTEVLHRNLILTDEETENQPGGAVQPFHFHDLYARFAAPITVLDCGGKCAPYNDRGVPFCCDIQHAIPTAYEAEWTYLETNTDLWHLHRAEDPGLEARLQAETPGGQVRIACQGHHQCQRGFRALTCRAFPFMPYLTRQGEFLGLSYYWTYEDRCWVISNLASVTPEYRTQFVAAFDWLFDHMPEERENFRYFSGIMRRVFGRHKRAIPLLHRNGKTYKVTPRNGRLRRIASEQLPKFGPYKLAAELPFPDEL